MMNKKSVLNILFYLLIGGVFGAFLAAGLATFGNTMGLERLSSIGDFLTTNNISVFIALVIVLFLPSAYFYIRGKMIYENIEATADDEDAYDRKIRKANRYMDMALTVNSVFMVLNFLTFGTTLDKTSNRFIAVLVIFLINVAAIIILEISVIRSMQHFDARLKGDPTTLRFTRDFIESCDEAEKQKIYKVGYRAFQASKATALGFIVLTTIGNMILDTGALPILMSCVWMLQNVVSYGYYSVKDQ